MPDPLNSSGDVDDPVIDHSYRFANVAYDESTGVLSVAGVPVDLEPRPRQLLALLLRHAGEVVSKDELLGTLWEGRPSVDNVVANAVNKLRRALGAEGASRIVNLPRIGYRLTGPVERIAVGQQLAVRLDLLAGQSVPGREGFRLEHALGPSGRSQVWLVCDTKLKEARVFKFAGDGKQLSSLKREYTFYRVLRSELGDRDDFARVLSANFSTPPYFLECEFGGDDLLAWAAHGGRLQNMARVERIALFLRIAKAVAAAHSVGVLHKDLKPANVLVSMAEGGTWSAKLTDFGSSGLLDRDRLAALGVTAMGLTMTHGISTGTMSGTPLYLAPELLAGQSPSTQSDVYALGLMLFQLLVGDLKRPMATGWQRDIGDDLLQDDLTAATEGRREDRLGSVGELVERLAALDQRRKARASLAAVTEHAARTQRALQQSRSRRPWVVAAFVGISLGLATSLWFYAQSRRALQAAHQEAARAQAINDFLNKDVLLSADVTNAAHSVTPVSMLDVLRRASANASKRFEGQPRTEASVRFQLGQIYLRMASVGDADKELTRALHQLEPLVAADDPLLLAIRFAMVRVRARQFDGSTESETRQLLEKAEAHAGAHALDPWPDLALLAWQARLDAARLGSASSPQALPIAQRVVALADKLPGGDIGARLEARERLASVYIERMEGGKADALFEEMSRPPFNSRSSKELLLLKLASVQAWTDHAAGHDDAAIKSLSKARDRLVDVLGADVVVAGEASTLIAQFHEARNDYAAAGAALREALRVFTVTLGPEHQYVRITAVNLGWHELDVNHPQQALALFEANRAWFKLHSSKGSYAPLDFGAAKALNDMNRPTEALALLADTAQENEDTSGPAEDVVWRKRRQAEHGRALIGTGRAAEGLALVQSAVATIQSMGGKYASNADPYRALLQTHAEPFNRSGQRQRQRQPTAGG